jgi:hypothetical protein
MTRMTLLLQIGHLIFKLILCKFQLIIRFHFSYSDVLLQKVSRVAQPV